MIWAAGISPPIVAEVDVTAIAFVHTKIEIFFYAVVADNRCAGYSPDTIRRGVMDAAVANIVTKPKTNTLRQSGEVTRFLNCRFSRPSNM